ncbi:MAG: hypothetical protein KatS3mg040_0577 [Candidatus Kapaibacterium sp.]|nr:MAG: hypothetical protein KatS3mg040_0577 [Candidatus Kapabacteria bacterium]
MERAIVVIPTYNERENIGRLIEALRRVLPSLDVLVVDDHSPDGTAELVRSMARDDARIHLLEREGKLGLGTAYCAGFRWALDRGYRIICQMDADFSHNPDDLPRLIAALDRADLVDRFAVYQRGERRQLADAASSAQLCSERLYADCDGDADSRCNRRLQGISSRTAAPN